VVGTRELFTPFNVQVPVPTLIIEVLTVVVDGSVEGDGRVSCADAPGGVQRALIARPDDGKAGTSQFADVDDRVCRCHPVHDHAVVQKIRALAYPKLWLMRISSDVPVREITLIKPVKADQLPSRLSRT